METMKLKPFQFCLSCLATKRRLINDSNVSRIYDDLILVKLPDKIVTIPYLFCCKCKGILQMIENFKQQCFKCIDELKMIYPDLALNDINPIFIKVEIESQLPVDANKDLNMIKNNFLKAEDVKPMAVPVDIVDQQEKDRDEVNPILTSDTFIQQTKKATRQRKKIAGRLNLKYKKTEKGLICQICSTPTKNLIIMKCHFRRFHSNPSADIDKLETGKYYCGYCESVQTEILKNHSLKVHSKHDNNNSNIKCLICNATFEKLSSFEDHFKRNHNYMKEPKLCCGVVFRTSLKYKLHYNQVHMKKQCTCDICGLQLSNKNNILKHMIHMHIPKENKYKCKICHKYFLDKEKYEKHIIREDERSKRKQMEDSKEEAVICDICGFIARKKVLLNLHISTKHLNRKNEQSRKLTCQYCGQTLKKASYLKNHILIHHSGGKKFSCHLCQRKFAYDHQLKRHIRVDHETLKWIACDVCGKEVRSTMIERHIQDSHGAKKFNCELCGEAFTTSRVLQKHLYQHSGTRPYNCDTCSQGYYCKDYLQKHYLRTHGKEVSFKEMKGTLPPDYSIVRKQIDQYSTKNKN